MTYIRKDLPAQRDRTPSRPATPVSLTTTIFGDFRLKSTRFCSYRRKKPKICRNDCLETGLLFPLGQQEKGAGRIMGRIENVEGARRGLLPQVVAGFGGIPMILEPESAPAVAFAPWLAQMEGRSGQVLGGAGRVPRRIGMSAPSGLVVSQMGGKGV